MIGLYGGTFDPIHFGHLRTVLEIKEQLQLDHVRFIPCHRPPHRGRPDATAGQRLAMLQLAIDQEPGFCLDSRELQRNELSYTVDTLESLRSDWPETPLCLIMGQDAFNHFDRWHRWQAIFDRAHVLVMHRPEHPPNPQPALKAAIETRLTAEIQDLRTALDGRVLFQPVTQLDISATHIRHLIQEHRNPRFLLPDAVIAFIHQHQLYHSLP